MGGHRDENLIGSSEVATDHASPGSQGLTGLAQTIGEGFQPADMSARRYRQSDYQRGWAGPHGHDVGDVARDGLPTKIERGRPIEAKIMPLDHGVRSDHESVIGRRHNRGVITRTDDGEFARVQTRNGALQSLVFAKVCNGWIFDTHRVKGSLYAMKISRALTAGSLVAAVALGASGCAATVTLEPANLANDPACADVSVRLPDKIADQERRTTDAQATAAYGNPTSVIVRCGLPGVTVSKLRCVTTSDIDWLVDPSQAPKYRFITFGRNPATEVIVDSTKVVGVTTLDELASAVGTVPATAKCSG